MNTRKLFLSTVRSTRPAAWAVSRQGAQNWFGDSKSDHLDVRCTLWKKKLPSRSQAAPLSSRALRTLQAELTEVKHGQSQSSGRKRVSRTSRSGSARPAARAQGLIPGDRGRAVKRLGSASPRMATSGPKSQLAIKAWVLGREPTGVDQHRCPDIWGRHSEDLCRLGSQSDREWLLGSQTGSMPKDQGSGGR
ncbi:hypothetical protein Q5P01_000330 [Channa striata]|uniref:Uncharacterized protein n=1 Tax=Channa striata TaxID=64152 RepID=A0AA88LN19_CHASR|nr:hypothetical protein Q5P01_000330 [Channa striata]